MVDRLRGYLVAPGEVALDVARVVPGAEPQSPRRRVIVLALNWDSESYRGASAVAPRASQTRRPGPLGLGWG